MNYFAAEDARTAIGELSPFEKTNTHPLRHVWSRNWDAYHKSILTGGDDSGLGFKGENSEIVECIAAEARSLIRNLVSLTTKARLSFTPVALQNDAATLYDSRIAKALIENIITEQQVDRLADEWTETAAVLGIGFCHAFWDPNLGDDYAADANSIVKTGDVDVEILPPWDVEYDWQRSFQDQDHVVIRRRVNRWDLAAQHEELRNEIESLPDADEHDSLTPATRESNLVWVYTFYHKPSPSLPEGRIIQYCDKDVVLFDGPNTYGCIPIIEMCPEVVMGVPGLGMPVFSQLLPLQEMLDHQLSAIATNQSANAVQNILVPDGCKISVQDLGGLNFINYNKDHGKPEPLNLSQTAPETFKFLDLCRGLLQELSGINGALRGAPPSGVTAAAAIATLSANAVELTQSFQKSHTLAMERLMTLIVNIYRRFATVERILPVAGKNQTYVAKRFIGSDLSNIKAVKMQVANALASTAAGRMQLGQDMIQAGLVKDVSQYVTVVTTGNLDVLTDPVQSESNLIESENESLAQGNPVQPLFIDDHGRHILKHRQLLSDPEIRMHSRIVDAVLSHISEHIELSRNLDPYVGAILETGKTPQTPPQE